MLALKSILCWPGSAKRTKERKPAIRKRLCTHFTRYKGCMTATPIDSHAHPYHQDGAGNRAEGPQAAPSPDAWTKRWTCTELMSNNSLTSEDRTSREDLSVEFSGRHCNSALGPDEGLFQQLCALRHLKKTTQHAGRGNSFVGKELATQAWGPECGFPELV